MLFHNYDIKQEFMQLKYLCYCYIPLRLIIFEKNLNILETENVL